MKDDTYLSYIRRFPKDVRHDLALKLTYKKKLEEDKSFKIPCRIWLAFLTPPKADFYARLPSPYRDVARLKARMLSAFKHPEQFLGILEVPRAMSESVTLSLLETLYDLEEQKILLEREQYDTWIEIAEKRGQWKLRYALEDAVFKTFDAEQYAMFESVVKKQMHMDKEHVQTIRAILKHALHAVGIPTFTIVNRQKNIYGAYQKIAVKGISVNKIFDIHGFRILVPSKADCLKVVALLHRLWPHFRERYKDYIEEPKKNGYQSIHTVLSCLEGRPIEFQVRTYEMDAIAESGHANHAEYKKQTTASASHARA